MYLEDNYNLCSNLNTTDNNIRIYMSLYAVASPLKSTSQPAVHLNLVSVNIHKEKILCHKQHKRSS